VQKENAARAATAAASRQADALAALDCLAAVAAEEELVVPGSGTPAHRSPADQDTWQQVRHTR
jgi:hypothetical protein